MNEYKLRERIKLKQSRISFWTFLINILNFIISGIAFFLLWIALILNEKGRIISAFSGIGFLVCWIITLILQVVFADEYLNYKKEKDELEEKLKESGD